MVLDMGNLWFVLFALPAGLVGYGVTRWATYWTDSSLASWWTFFVSLVVGLIGAFFSWVLLVSPSMGTMMLPVVAPFAGFGFGCAAGALMTIRAGGWRRDVTDVGSQPNETGQR